MGNKGMTLNICIYKKQLDNAVIIFLEKMEDN